MTRGSSCSGGGGGGASVALVVFGQSPESIGPTIDLPFALRCARERGIIYTL